MVSLPRLVLVALILANFLYFGSYASQRHLAFETGAFDTGVYTQPLWNFIHGRGFAVSLIEDNGPLRWATHVEPILYLIAPLYALWPDPRTLFWLQIGALSLTAIPLYALSRRRLHNNAWLALVVVLAYFLMPATQAVTLFDFHAVTLAPLFLLSGIYFLDQALARQGKSFWVWPEVRSQVEKDRAHWLFYLLSALFLLLALSTKEDISLHIFMLGLYLFILRRRWQEGVPLILVGLAWFYVTFQVIIPAYRVGGGHSIYAAWFETLGDTPLEIALSPVTAPDKVLQLIFRPGSIPALTMLTLPLALLPWLGLPLFALAAPSLAFILLSQNPTLRQLETWHYAAPMLPFVMLGTIDGLARINEQLSRRNKQISWLRFLQPDIALKILTLLLLITTLTYSYIRGYLPFSRLYEWPEVTAHHELGRQIAASIPAEASVLAQAQLIPYVAHREKLGIWSGPLLTEYDYIWLDLSHPKLPNRFDAHGDLLIGLIYEHGFGVVTHTDGYLLLKKGGNREVIGDDLFTFTQFKELPPQAQPFEAIFGDTIKLTGVKTEVRRLATSETEPQVILYFEALQQPEVDYFLFLYRLDASGRVVGATDYPQPAMFWWPTSRWQKGDKHQVRVNTIPFWTGDSTMFAYAIGFSRVNDAWDQSARLPITWPEPALNPAGTLFIDQGTLLTIAAFRRFPGFPIFRDFASLPYPQSLTVLPQAGQKEYIAGNEEHVSENR